MGELEVMGTQPAGELLILRVVDVLDEHYWQGVTDRAKTGESPPGDLVLYREDFSKQMTRNDK
ncbi:hypothetical protein CVCC1112_2340 [Paenarthrobacter nicotinovorans]|nr:hypothetical protein CVCC1112_2340 [Paenarthrobacter nicotinovorans]